MRKFAWLGLLFCSIHVHSQEVDIWWDPEVIITEAPENGNVFVPQVACDNEGNVVVVWAEESPEGMACMLSRKEGESFSTPQQISGPESVIDASVKAGPSVEAHNDVFYLSYFIVEPDSQLVIRKSLDAGVTWTSEIQVDQSISDEAVHGQKMAIDSQGDPHICTEKMIGADPEIGIISSQNTGESFSPFTSIVPPPQWEFIGTPNIYIQGSTHIVLWRDYYYAGPSHETHMAISVDNGVTFAEPILIYSEYLLSNSEQVSDPEVFLLGDYVYVTLETVGTPPRILFRTYDLEAGAFLSGGTDFSETTILGSVMENPTIGYQSSWGITGITWHDDSFGMHQIKGAFWIPDSDFSLFSITTDNAGQAHTDAHFVTPQDESNQLHLVCVAGEQQSIVYLGGHSSNLSLNEQTPLEISIFPNPATTQIQAILSASPIGSYLQITDSNGRLVKTIQVKNELEVIDVSDLSPGNYLLGNEQGYGTQFTIAR